MTTSPGWMPPALFRTTSPGWGDSRRDPINVTLGGIRLRTDGYHEPATGWEYSLADIAGWWEATQNTSSVTQHPSGDGNIMGAPRKGARVITITGWIAAADNFGPASAEAAIEALSQLRQATLVIEETQRGLSREADVVVSVQPRDRSGVGDQDVLLSLVAHDPLRYASGTRPLTNGTQTLINRGDETAWPVLELVGPHSAITITHPGGVWTLPALGAGVERTVDCRHGRVFNAAGNRVFGAAAGSGAWPRVPAGGGSWSVSGVGSGGARVRRQEAWS